MPSEKRPERQTNRRRFQFGDGRKDVNRYGQALFKKLGFSYKRIRTSLKSRQMGLEPEAKEQALKTCWRLFHCGWIDLYFADESTFSMNPCLAYAWQEKGKQIEIFLQRDKKMSLFSIFRPDNVAVTYPADGNINSEFLIHSIDDFCQYLDKPTVLVIDNAPTHITV